MTDKCPIKDGPVFVHYEGKWVFYGVKKNNCLLRPWLSREEPGAHDDNIYDLLAEGDVLFTHDMLSAYRVVGKKRSYHGPVSGTHLEVCAGQPEGDAGRDSRVDEHHT